jgi:hypothetical protein
VGQVDKSAINTKVHKQFQTYQNTKNQSTAKNNTKVLQISINWSYKNKNMTRCSKLLRH